MLQKLDSLFLAVKSPEYCFANYFSNQKKNFKLCLKLLCVLESNIYFHKNVFLYTQYIITADMHGLHDLMLG